MGHTCASIPVTDFLKCSLLASYRDSVTLKVHFEKISGQLKPQCVPTTILYLLLQVCNGMFEHIQLDNSLIL